MGAALELRGLTLRYKRFTLGPLDLCLEPGRIAGLVGPNGSGKTTTLRCIAGNLYPDAGAIAVHGRQAAPHDGSWKGFVGFVPDKPIFFEWMTAGRFLEFMSSFYPDWSFSFADQLARRFMLDLSAKVRHLSAGNRMKVFLVAALAHHPRLALFDEPTAGLDPVVRSEVFDTLWEMMDKEKMTILYSTHIIDDLHRLADDLVFLNDGKLSLHSSKDDLIDQWRWIQFSYEGDCSSLEAVVKMKQVGQDHEVLSSDGNRTLAALSAMGAQQVRARALSLEEIAVTIMKGNHDVSHHHR